MTIIRITIQVGDYEGDIESGILFKQKYAEVTEITNLDVLPDVKDEDKMLAWFQLCYNSLLRNLNRPTEKDHIVEVML